MSLTAFLKTHYDHPVKDSDHDQDQKLPFVSHANLLSVVFTINPSLDFHCIGKYLALSRSKRSFIRVLFTIKKSSILSGSRQDSVNLNLFSQSFFDWEGILFPYRCLHEM